MHASASRRLSRIFAFVIPALFLAGCFGEGEGQERIINTPVPPEPPVPPGFCDPVNFEPQCPQPAGFTNFEGGVVTVEDNPPNLGAGNDSLRVGRMLKFRADSGFTFGGSTIALAQNFDVQPGSSFTMKVWSTRSVRVLFQPEPVDGSGVGLGVEVTHGGSGWEELTFPVTGLSGLIDRITLIFDNGVLGDAGADPDNWTFYFDDITLVSGPALDPTVLPVDFENDPLSYNFGPDGGFEGAVSDVIENPDPSGINTTDQTARMQKFRADSGLTFGGSNLTLAENVDFSQGEAFTMKVWATRQVPVLFKLEDAVTGLPENGKERSVDHSGSGTWEELCFDFSGETAGFTSNSITFIFDIDVLGDAANDPDTWTFYYDEIEQVADCGGGGPEPEPFSTITFDDPAITYALRGFGGAEDSTVVADPDDAANNVVQVNRSDAAETFAGTVVSTGANETVGVIPLDATNTTMSVRVRSPAAGITVRLKIENSQDSAVSVETEAVTTVAGGWETLAFDFANEAAGTAAFDPAATYDRVVIFFNFGVDGATAGAQTFYFDDIDIGAGGGGPGFPTIGFDDPSITYALRGFGGAEDSTVVVDPTDATNMVVQVNRSAAAETFAGTVVSTGPNETVPVIPLDAMNTQMSVRVWSPEAGITVRMKIENSLDSAVSVETEAVTTVAGDWETLTFNFLNEVPGTPAFDPTATYDRIVIFFNFGVAGATAGAQTFYFDDIMVVAGTGGGGPGPAPFSPITFDDPAVTYTLRGFGGAENSFVTNDPAGGTNMVVQVDRSAAAETFAGTVVSTGPNESIDVIPLDASNTQMNLRVYSAAAGVQVRLKIENSLDPAVSVETEATTTTSGDWETLTFDFANEAAGTPAFNPAATYDKVVIFFNFGVDGATAGAQTYYFDDIDVGPGPGGPAGFPAVTFDDPALTYTLRGFGGAEDSTVVADPTDPSNNVAQVNRSAAAETFAGTVVSTGPNESIDVIPLDASNTQMNVRVFSAATGVQVRLKIENSVDPAVSVETEATTTTSGDWETLTFDFANEAAGTPAFNPAATYDKVVIFFNFGVDGATAGAQTYYFDDIDVGPGPGGSSGFVNGDFEANGGSLEGWTAVFGPPNIGTAVADNSGQGGRAGTVARLNAAGQGTSGNDVLIVQGPIGAGTIQAGDTIDVSFDLYGSLAGAGGVVFVEVIFLDGAGNDNGRDFLRSDPTPYFPNNTWTTYSGGVTAGTTVGGGTADVSGGVTLSLKASCGADVSCAVDASFDNVTFTIN